MTVAVVVPVYRNGATLAELADRLAVAMDEPWVLRLVVDACPEDSLAIASLLAEGDARVRVTALPANEGQHRAIAHGLAAEPEADVWVCLDGDLQDPPEAVPLLVGSLRDRSVVGVFAGRRGDYESRGRMLTGRVHRRLLRSMSDLPADAGAYFAMDRRLRDGVVHGVLERGVPSVVLAAGLAGLPLDSVPVPRAERTVGSSAWTSRARARQSLRTLACAARTRRHPGIAS